MLSRLLLLVMLALPAAAWADPAFIYLVRHGEKGAGKDPALTAAGAARASHIAALLHRTGINAVYSSDTVRTQQTAQPSARMAGVAVQTYDGGNSAALVERLHALDGGTVLVVGHSNTLTDIVRMLGGAPGADILDDEYDRVYQLSRGADGKVVTVVLSSQLQP